MKYTTYKKEYTILPTIAMDISVSSGLYDIKIQGFPIKNSRAYFVKDNTTAADVIIFPFSGVSITKNTNNSINIYKENDTLMIQNNTNSSITAYVEMEAY